MAADHLEQRPGPPSGRRRAECDLCPSRSMHLSLFSLFLTPRPLLHSFLQYRPLPLPPLDLHQPPRPLPSSLTLCLPLPFSAPRPGPRPSVSSPHLIHSCLWHSHISPSIHLLCLSLSPRLFPSFPQVVEQISG